MDVAGVDGCKSGWLVVRVDAANRLRVEDVSIIPTFAELVDATADCVAVAIDVPIGLMEDAPRAPDGEARKAIGARRSSVFPAPVAATVDAKTYEEACDLSLAACGKKLSQQAFAILPKIREVNRSMTPALQSRIREVHPEVCFWRLNGRRPLEYAKLKAEGAAERLHILKPAFIDDVASLDPPRGAKRDDLYDALVATWSAGRIAYGTEENFPSAPSIDGRGLRMEIVY